MVYTFLTGQSLATLEISFTYFTALEIGCMFNRAPQPLMFVLA